MNLTTAAVINVFLNILEDLENTTESMRKILANHGFDTHLTSPNCSGASYSHPKFEIYDFTCYTPRSHVSPESFLAILLDEFVIESEQSPERFIVVKAEFDFASEAIRNYINEKIKLKYIFKSVDPSVKEETSIYNSMIWIVGSYGLQISVNDWSEWGAFGITMSVRNVPSPPVISDVRYP